MKTPRIIWQTWKSKDPSKIPTKLYDYSEKWRKLHPKYKYILLDDADLRKIVEETVPEYLDKYDSFTCIIERVDFARYALMYSRGGIYADLDTDPLKAIDTWVDKNAIVLGCEPREHAKDLYNRERVICNAFMISPPGQKFWIDLMKYIVDNYEENYKPVENTGPMAMTKFLETAGGNKYEEELLITDPCVFFPLKGDNQVAEGCNIRESYVAHVWENTWVKPWYQDPMWFNARYWTYVLVIIFMILWLWCHTHQ